MAVVVLPGLLLCMYRHTPLAADLRLAVALQAVLQGQMLRSALSPAFTFSEFAAARCRLVCLFLAAPPPRAAPPPEGRGCPCALPVPPAAWKRHRVRSALLVRGSGPPHRRGLCPVPGALPRLPLGPRGGASPRRRRPALRAVTWPRQPRSLRAPPWLRRPPPAPCSCACSAWRCPAAARCTPRAPCPSTPSPSTRYGPPGGRYRVWQSAGDGGGRWRGGGGEAGRQPAVPERGGHVHRRECHSSRRAASEGWEGGVGGRGCPAGRERGPPVPVPSPPHTATGAGQRSGLAEWPRRRARRAAANRRAAAAAASQSVRSKWSRAAGGSQGSAAAGGTGGPARLGSAGGTGGAKSGCRRGSSAQRRAGSPRPRGSGSRRAAVGWLLLCPCR